MNFAILHEKTLSTVCFLFSLQLILFIRIFAQRQEQHVSAIRVNETPTTVAAPPEPARRAVQQVNNFIE